MQAEAEEAQDISTPGAGSSNDHESSETTAPDDNTIDEPSSADVEEYSSLTVQQLQAILREYGLPVTGVKRDLMRRLASRQVVDDPPTTAQL